MIFTGQTSVTDQALAWAEREHFSWIREPFGGRVFEAAFVDAEAGEDQ